MLATKATWGALTNAEELTLPGTVVWDEDFESGDVPVELSIREGVSLGITRSDVIEGDYSLLLGEPDHTRFHSLQARTIPDLCAGECRKDRCGEQI